MPAGHHRAWRTVRDHRMVLTAGELRRTFGPNTGGGSVAGFFKEWGKAIISPASRLAGWTPLAKALASILPAALGASAIAAIAAWVKEPVPVPVWAVCLSSLALLWLSVTAGLAAERASRPSVHVSSLHLDAGCSLFFVDVTNGPVPAKVQLLVNSVVDSFGTRHVEHSWEGHWRGRPAEFDGSLSEHEEGQYGLLGIGKHLGSGNPALFIWSRDEVQPGKEPKRVFVPISRDLPLEKQGGLTVRVVATVVSPTGERGKPQRLRLSVAPDPGSVLGYKVTQATYGFDAVGKRRCRVVYRRILYRERQLLAAFHGRRPVRRRGSRPPS